MKHLFYFCLVLLSLLLYSLFNKANVLRTDNISNDLKYSANWLTDLTVVKVKSKEERKPILMNFTGSDWCAGCIRLDREIFSSPVFINYANEHLVLMKIDYPLGVKQEESLVDQNNLLYDSYEIEGLPTIILMDSDGEIYRDTGYGKEEPENFVNRIESLLSN